MPWETLLGGPQKILLTARYIFGHFVPAMQIAQKPAEGGPENRMMRFIIGGRKVGLRTLYRSGLPLRIPDPAPQTSHSRTSKGTPQKTKMRFIIGGRKIGLRKLYRSGLPLRIPDPAPQKKSDLPLPDL